MEVQLQLFLTSALEWSGWPHTLTASAHKKMAPVCTELSAVNIKYMILILVLHITMYFIVQP